MKQVARSSAEWRDVINKENLFLITFGFHWRQIHGKVTADVFGKRMREELRVWMDRQRLVRREESTPTKARSPKPADRVHGAPPLSRPREPSLPIIATLASAGATPPPMVGTTPPPMEITRRTPVPIAGPSDNRRQVSRGEVSRQEADDRELAERLQAALHDGHPLSFRELDQSESSTEGDDEDDESEKKGKGKAKMPSKGKVKAGGTGMTRVFHSPTEDEDKQDEVGKTQSPKVKEGRKAMKGTGEPFPTACKTCVRRNVLCEKREGGQPPCVTCKRSKVKCSLVGKKLKRRVVKTRPMITDSDFEQTAAAEASAPKRSAPKRSAAVNKTLKRSRRQAKVEPELSEEEEVVPKKKARNQDRIAGDAEEVLGVVQGMSLSQF